MGNCNFEDILYITQQALLLAKEKGLTIIEQKDAADNFKDLGVSFDDRIDNVTVSRWHDGKCEWVKLFYSWNPLRTWKQVYKFLNRCTI